MEGQEINTSMPNVGSTEVESAHEKTAEQIQHEHEKNMFKTHVETSGEQIPENFENAGAWFESLKEAQKQYTQKSQELSELKKTTETPVKAEPEIQFKPEDMLTDQLRIPKQEEKKTPEKPIGVTDETYNEWSAELAASGSFSDATRNKIKESTGFSDRMLDDYVYAQKARLRETYNTAAEKVGGMERLDKIFKWASANLGQNELQAINIGLSSPTYEVTLRGVASMYDAATQEKRAAEPAPTPNLTQVPASESGVTPYKSQVEFKSERNSPMFEYDPKFRDQVQKRMAMTDWNTLPLV